MSDAVSLKAEAAYSRDVGRVVARMDGESMKAIGASTGDIVPKTVMAGKDGIREAREEDLRARATKIIEDNREVFDRLDD